MTFAGWLTIVLFIGILTALALPLGRYMAAVYTGERTFLDSLFLTPERLARRAARDGYELGDVIGRGPRSTVYRAQAEAAGPFVALKVFAPGTCTRPAWEAQLRRSVEQWRGLAHPQLVPIQRGAWWDDAPYLVMEYVPHGSLADRLARQTTPGRGTEGLARALRLLEQLARLQRTDDFPTTGHDEDQSEQDRERCDPQGQGENVHEDDDGLAHVKAASRIAPPV